MFYSDLDKSEFRFSFMSSRILIDFESDNELTIQVNGFEAE